MDWRISREEKAVYLEPQARRETLLQTRRQNNRATTDGRSYILHRHAVGECVPSHLRGKEPPSRERPCSMPARSVGYSAVLHTTAALLFDEGEAREKDVLKYLTQGQIRLELCRDLL